MSLINKKSEISLGISFSIAEVICTITIASIVKFISVELSVFMILFFRYLFCIPLLLITSIYQRKSKAFYVVSKSNLAILLCSINALNAVSEFESLENDSIFSPRSLTALTTSDWSFDWSVSTVDSVLVVVILH